MKKKLNIGCAGNVLRDHVNLDISKYEGVDIVQDLSKFPWKIPDNEFDEVYAKFVLEHLEDNIKVMEEIWRICKNGAKVKIWVPHQNSKFMFGDLQHKRGYTINSFDFFCGENYNYPETYSPCTFKKKIAKECGGRLLEVFKFLRLDKFLIKYLNNVCAVLYFELEVIKHTP